MPEDALNERDKRLRGDADSVDDIRHLMKEDQTSGDIEMGRTDNMVCID